MTDACSTGYRVVLEQDSDRVLCTSRHPSLAEREFSQKQIEALAVFLADFATAQVCIWFTSHYCNGPRGAEFRVQSPGFTGKILFIGGSAMVHFA